jgi:hypothetical protein
LKDRIKYGVIDESHLTFITPRTCEDGGFEHIEGALQHAASMIYDGAREVAVVRCRYNLDSGLWYEIGDGQGIYIDSSNWEFENEED